MPATSAAQQHLFGMALAYKRGEASSASPEVKKVAGSMTDSQLHDFAATRGLADGGSAKINAALRIARAPGGGVPGSDIPSFERSEMRNVGQSPYGLSVGAGGGRLDKNNMSVGAGAYVLPADVVAGLGDGNTLGGAHVWDQILSSMPWGIARPVPGPHRGPPQPPHDPALMEGITGKQREPITPTLADGGEAQQVPIASADGEYILSPEQVLRIGQFYSNDRDRAAYPASHAKMMRRGHRVLDSFVKQKRGDTIRHLKKLKGPVGSSEPHKGHA